MSDEKSAQGILVRKVKFEFPARVTHRQRSADFAAPV